MAEVYWDMEWTLQQQGFDYAYDKRLYDRLREGPPGRCANTSMRGWITRTNWPASWKTTTSRGRRRRSRLEFMRPRRSSPSSRRVCFFHEGQFTGRKKRISPHLGRRPNEPIDANLAKFYDQLLAVLRHPVAREGRWRLLECTPAWEGNWTWDCFLVFAWQGSGGEWLLAAVNYAPNQSQCRVRLPFPELGGRKWRLADALSAAVYSATAMICSRTDCTWT